MRNFLQEIADQMNLIWAWEKVSNFAQSGDASIDEIELANFELNLEKNLEEIRVQFLKRKYELKPIRPMPFPKNKTSKGKNRVRQIFNISIRDQVAWCAIVNVLGPILDVKMPTWSYGNRLYRTIWIEENQEGTHERKIGYYRHSSGKIYLPFNQAWPIFKRHVYISTKRMTNFNECPVSDDYTKKEEELIDQLDSKHRCPFVSKDYWIKKNNNKSEKNNQLYWCSIDLEKFYPSIKLSIIQDNIIENIPEDWRDDGWRTIKFAI